MWRFFILHFANRYKDDETGELVYAKELTYQFYKHQRFILLRRIATLMERIERIDC